MVDKRIIVFVTSLLFTFQLVADWGDEQRRIEFLFNEIEGFEGVFIRNGVEYNSQKAVAHLRMKLNRAINSWFAPDKEEWTAELFIDELATKSSLSDRYYHIKYKDGRTVKSGEWLKERLKHYKTETVKEE